MLIFLLVVLHPVSFPVFQRFVTLSDASSRGSCVSCHTDLATARLDHELAGKVGGRLGLQWTDDDALVQRVTRHNLHPTRQAYPSVLDYMMKPHTKDHHLLKTNL